MLPLERAKPMQITLLWAAAIFCGVNLKTVSSAILHY